MTPEPVLQPTESGNLILDVLSICDRPWAMKPSAFQALLDSARNPDLAAVAARVGQRVEGGGNVRNHNGTAVLDIRGPLFRYRSIWTWLLGGTAIADAA